jgi:hypothetical protein
MNAITNAVLEPRAQEDTLIRVVAVAGIIGSMKMDI